MQITYDPARELQIGDTASLTRSIGDEDVRTFAEISGDRNPVHLNDEFAAGTLFKKRTPHRVLSGALISAVLGMTMLGPGTICLSQTLKFKALVNTARRSPRGRRRGGGHRVAAPTISIFQRRNDHELEYANRRHDEYVG